MGYFSNGNIIVNLAAPSIVIVGIATMIMDIYIACLIGESQLADLCIHASKDSMAELIDVRSF